MTGTVALRACCSWLKNMLSVAGEQGFSVVAVTSGDLRGFRVQATPFTRWQAQTWNRVARESLLPDLWRDEDGRLAPVLDGMSFPLWFCPLCGAELACLIQCQRDEFDRLAASHGRFVCPLSATAPQER